MARPRELPSGKDRDFVEILSAELSPEAKGMLGPNGTSIAQWLRKVDLALLIRREPVAPVGSVCLVTDARAPARSLRRAHPEGEFIDFLSGTALYHATKSSKPVTFKWCAQFAFTTVRPRHALYFESRIGIWIPSRLWTEEASLSMVSELAQTLADWEKPRRDLAGMSRLKFRGLRFALDVPLSPALSILCAHMNGVLGDEDIKDVLSGKRIRRLGVDYPLGFTMKGGTVARGDRLRISELLSPKGLRHFLAILDVANSSSGAFDWQAEAHLARLGVQRDARRRARSVFKKEDRDAAANFVTLLSTLEFAMPSCKWKGELLQGEWIIPGMAWRGRLNPDLISESRQVRMPRLPLLLNHKDHGFALWLFTQLHFTPKKRMQISTEDLVTKFGRNLHAKRGRWEATLERDLAYLRALGAIHFSKRKRGPSPMLTISAPPADYFPFRAETEFLEAERSHTEATLSMHPRMRALTGKLNASDFAALVGFAPKERLAKRLGVSLARLRKYMKDGNLPPSVQMTVRRDEKLVSWLVQRADS